MKVYLVGGAVRDILLGKSPKDKDYVVTGTTPEHMIKLGFERVGNEFPVFLHPETKDEYALARTEKKVSSGYTGFTCFSSPETTIEEDLFRRDITINAMALDDKTKKIIDPYNGKSDLNNKIIRHVSEAFMEDPLRILRIARFRARMPDFIIADETLILLKEMVLKGMLKELKAERVWKEVSRALTEKSPELFFETLNEIDGLKDLFPVIEKMKGIPQRKDYHAEGDVYVHNMLVVKEAAKLSSKLEDKDKLMIVLGALLHDVGKTETPYELLYDKQGLEIGFHHGHDGEEVCNRLIDDFCDNLKVPTDLKVFSKIIAKNHQLIHTAKNLSHKKITKIFDELNLKSKSNKDISDDEYLRNILLCCKADALGRKALVNGVIQEVSKDYSIQENIFLKSYEGYKDYKNELKAFINNYKNKKEKDPDSKVIKEELYNIRRRKIQSKIKTII